MSTDKHSESIAELARERLYLKDIPEGWIDRLHLVYQSFAEMRYKYDPFGNQDHRTSSIDSARDLFIWLQCVNPNASSFLDLGLGTGYLVRCALKLGYNAIGVEISDEYVRVAKESLNVKGYDPSRVIQADFLDDHFSDEFLNGMKVNDFDAINLYAPEKIVFKTIPKIVPNMKQGSYFLTVFDQPFFSDDIEGYLVERNIPAQVKADYRGLFFLRRS